MLVKVYKHETVTSVAEIEAPSEKQALQYARVTNGMGNAPEFSELTRTNPRISLKEVMTHEKKGSKGNDE